MPWNTQGGGGPWGGGGGGNGPWGGGPQHGGGGGPNPPDFDDMIRKGQDRLRQMFSGGGGGNNRLIALLSVGGLAVLLLWSSAYRVQPGEQGVQLLFGEYISTTEPGLHFWVPIIGQVETPNVQQTNTINIGFRAAGGATRTARTTDVAQESLMLTGDQNIADIDFVVQWRISSASDYLFKIRDPETTIKVAAESVMREVVGQTPLQDVLTTGREEIQQNAEENLQALLDSYEAGIAIADVKLQQTDPPSEVIDAFNDVQRARLDKERLQNEAQAYANDIVPRANGQAERMNQEAIAYKAKVVAEAKGEASRFNAVYQTYLSAKDVTTQRLYLESLQEVLAGTEKVIIDNNGQGNGVTPYLPLPELRKRQQESN